MKIKKGIVGYGGFGREIYWSLSGSDRIGCKFFVEDQYYKKDENENVLPLSEFNPKKFELIIAIADPQVRKRIVTILPEDTKYFTHIHDTAQIHGNDVEIGEGSIICANSIITTNCIIGKHSHLNISTTIGHDCNVGNFFTTAPGVHISGNSLIGECVYFGTGSSNRQKTIICNDVFIGMNSGVIKNITEPGTYIGTPAIKIKRKK